MASVQSKKVAAIIAAVLAHESGAEVAADVPEGPTVGPAIPPSMLPPAVWAWSGRQEAMQNRVLWQRRILRSR